MTEDEANERWCPFTRVQGRIASLNRDETNQEQEFPDGTLCVASHCMAWRWNSSAREHGHCGLAGDAIP